MEYFDTFFEVDLLDPIKNVVEDIPKENVSIHNKGTCCMIGSGSAGS